MSDLNEILKRWGAPGDYGYYTAVGQLLYELHKYNATRRDANELERDAARYRWLRSRDPDTIATGGVFAGITPENLILTEEHLDVAVDMAMGEV